MSSNNIYLIGIFVASTVLGLVIMRMFLGGNKEDGKSSESNSSSKPKPAKKLTVSDRIPAKNREKKGYTRAEVAKHNKEDDVWLIIDGKVYDVTDYVPEHPGGDAILTNAGKDSTAGFKGPQHPVSVWDVIALYHIGHVVE